MRTIIVIVWLAAVAYGTPSLMSYDTIEMLEQNYTVAYCMNTGSSLQVMVMINFVLLYCIPLVLMSVMYTKISIVLWKTSFAGVGGGVAGGNSSVSANSKSQDNTTTKQCSSKACKTTNANVKDSPETHSQCPLVAETDTNNTTKTSIPTSKRNTNLQSTSKHSSSIRSATSAAESNPEAPNNNKKLKKCNSSGGQNALASRRKVIRLLISIVGSFAACMLPHHIRLLYEMYAPRGIPSFTQQLIPPFTFLFFYLNSALNPILYAFLSDNFRKSLREVCGCHNRNRYIAGSPSKTTKIPLTTTSCIR